jgi:acyl dehydratase
MSATSGFMPAEMQTAVNYGSDKVRFMEAVPVDSKIRGRFVLTDAQYKKNGRWLVKTSVTIEIDGVEKPAAIIETLTLYIVKE